MRSDKRGNEHKLGYRIFLFDIKDFGDVCGFSFRLFAWGQGYLIWGFGWVFFLFGLGWFFYSEVNTGT